MRYILLFLLAFTTLGDGLKRAPRINMLVQEAGRFYQQQQYQRAIAVYNYLNDSLHVKDNALLLNLAHATYHTGNLTKARRYYSQLRNNADLEVREAALNQLGVISFRQDNTQKALYYFKQVIIQNSLNETARFNYELVKKYRADHPDAGLQKNTSQNKKQSENKETPSANAQTGVRASETGNPDDTNDLNNPGQETPQNKLQEAANNSKPEANQLNKAPQISANPGTDKAEKGQNNGDQEGLSDRTTDEPGALGNKGGDEEITARERNMQTLRKRLRQTDLSAEKATVLLDAMRNAELQYLQQLPRKPTKKAVKDKPDW